jgi:hypothetical protein
MGEEMRLTALCLLATLSLLAGCGQPPAQPTATGGRTPVSRPSPTAADPGRLVEPATPAPGAAPLLATRTAQLQGALAAGAPLNALEGLDSRQEQAVSLALADARVLSAVTSAEGRPLRAEVFGAYLLGPGDMAGVADECRERACHRVEIYNYANNSTVLAIADPAAGLVHSVTSLAATQPTVLPRHLMELAAQIALAAPEVRDELELAPDATMIQQPQMKVQFQASACERSRHLCVAPIFVWGERALWVIVDLVDYTIVGLRWTELGASSRRPVSEQRLQDDVVTAMYCERSTALERGGWSLSYLLTASDGLRLDDVRFNGAPVLASAKLVDVHISYSSREGFGYSDALGCPAFSAAAVVAWDGPRVVPIAAVDGVGGFALEQRFRSELWPMPCNYAYVQRYEFYDDGRFRVAFVNEGRGCGNDGTYRPVLRIAPAGGSLGFAEWDGQGWRPWASEGWRLQDAETAYTPEGYQYRLADESGDGWFIEPGQGQFGEGDAGDNAYLYVSRRHAGRDEGESDTPTLGDCCNSDERQGPERFLEPAEPIDGAPLVLWYVPQLKNADAPGAERCWADARLQGGVFVPEVWPCSAGPMFVPTGDR